jgi:hypothetical protein
MGAGTMAIGSGTYTRTCSGYITDHGDYPDLLLSAKTWRFLQAPVQGHGRIA